MKIMINDHVAAGELRCPKFVACVLLGLLAFASSMVARAEAADGRPPNVIVILADDLGIVDVNAYAKRYTGDDVSKMYYETPNIDRLIDEGLSFSQAYACHLCSPSRASLLTGKYAARTGFTTAVGGKVRTFYNQAVQPPSGYLAQDAIEWRDKISIQQALLNGTTRDALASGHPLDRGEDQVTLAEAMPNHDAAFLGKWHIGGHGSDGWQPKDQGFNELAYYDEGSSPYFNWRRVWDRKNLGASKMPQKELTKGRSAPKPNQEGDHDRAEGYLTDDLTSQAVDFIRQRGSSDGADQKPFFLYFCHFAVHTPFQAKAEDIEYFERKETRGWNKHGNAIYASMVRGLDDSVGRILDALDETGLDDDTLVVFTSDNGGVTYTSPIATWNAPFKGGKAMHFEGGIRVPLVFRWKGNIDQTVWSDVPVDCNDIFPTVLEMTGYDPSPMTTGGEIDGRSLKPLMNDPENQKGQYPRDTFFWHYPLNVVVKHPEDGFPSAPSSAIRKGDWKLIFDWSGKLRLYNIADDPFEHDEVSDQNFEKAISLFRELNDWIDANVEEKYTPAINPDYDPTKESRARPFVDLRRKFLGDDRAIRTIDDDPRFKMLNQ